MKIKSVFKKEHGNKTASKIQSLDKEQLEKVIGGVEGVMTTEPETTDGSTEVVFRPHRGEVR